MDQAAEDDSERARNRARLYAPPPGVARSPRTAPSGVSGTQAAAAVVARLGAEDAQLQGLRRPGG